MSRSDKEAIVEYLLLEDIKAEYCRRLDRYKESTELTTEAGRLARESNINRFTYIIHALTIAIETSMESIHAGEYTKVRRAIKERLLQRKAKKK